MKQPNFEEQAKKALENRDITPTPQSWDRLNAMLTAAEGMPVKRVFPYWNVAAVILICIGLFSIYVTQTEDAVDVALPANHNTIVKQNETEPIQKADAEVAPVQAKASATGAVTSTHLKRFNHQSINNQAVAQISEKPISQPAESSFSNNKSETTIAQSNENNQVSDSQLVASLANQLNSRKSFKTDPTALLNAANADINSQYRNQMLAAVVQKVGEVRFAVQNRNTLK